MIIYRIRRAPTELADEVVEFYPTKQDAESAWKKIEKESARARLEKLEIPSGREALAEALNLAGAHPGIWDAQEVVKTKGWNRAGKR